MQTAIESVRDADLTSLQTAIEVERDADLLSLQNAIDSSLLIGTVALASGVDSKTVTFSTDLGGTFSAAPSVVMMVKAGATDAIIAAQISSISASAVTFQFTETTPNANYSLVVMASS